MKLYRISAFIVILAMLFAGFAPANVRAQDSTSAGTIVDIAASDPQFSTLVAAVQTAGLAETLSGEGPFTVFAPTNAAFAKLGEATITALLNDPATLQGILLYHALSGSVYASDVLQRSFATTINGADVVFTQRGGSVYINDARIMVTDIQASNGVIHVIDTVILPPTKDIVDTAAANPNFKGLVAAVQAAGLVETLKGEGPFTVFAPTDAAFKKLGRSTLEALLKEPQKLAGILTYHVVAGKLYSGDVLKTTSVATVNGSDVVFTLKKGQPYINNARITVTNILTTNGVIHVIDAVILPPVGDIVDTVVANPKLKLLAAGVQAAGLVETLKGEGPFTVFAPTDAAFKKLGMPTLQALSKDPARLTSILTYHVAAGKYYSPDLAQMVALPSVNGADLLFGMNKGKLTVNNVRFVTTDIIATNGVIHIIDAVLLPPTKDIVETAVANPKLKGLVAAVQIAGLVETLKGEGPFTVFAPVDSAFYKLDRAALEALKNNPEELKKILLYHVVSGKVYAGDVVKLTEAETVLGEKVTISVKDGKVYVNDARVITTDIQTTNGVIHLIDTVLLPPTE
ncbi:MAG TPA: fasciclin domain-containing protein [Anaerolineaceae bacterium]